MRLRIWSILCTVPPTSVTLLRGSGRTSSMGSFSEVCLPAAGWFPVAACPATGWLAGEEEELWDIITPVNNINTSAG